MINANDLQRFGGEKKTANEQGMNSSMQVNNCWLWTLDGCTMRSQNKMKLDVFSSVLMVIWIIVILIYIVDSC